MFSGQLSIHPTNQRLLRAVWKVYLTIRQWSLIWLVWKWPMLLCWMKELQQLKLWVFVTGKITDLISYFHERTSVASFWIQSVCHQGQNAEWNILHTLWCVQFTSYCYGSKIMEFLVGIVVQMSIMSTA